MTVTIDRAAVAVLDQVTWDCTTDGDLREYYSGRGMNGRTCLGLVVDGIDDFVRWLFGVANAADGEEPELAEQFQAVIEQITSTGTRHDSMGLQQIFYWPSVQVEPRS